MWIQCTAYIQWSCMRTCMYVRTCSVHVACWMSVEISCGAIALVSTYVSYAWQCTYVHTQGVFGGNYLMRAYVFWISFVLFGKYDTLPQELAMQCVRTVCAVCNCNLRTREHYFVLLSEEEERCLCLCTFSAVIAVCTFMHALTQPLTLHSPSLPPLACRCPRHWCSCHP